CMKSWFTIDDLPLIKSGEPIITIKRNGDKLDDVIIHRSVEELEQIIRNDSGTLGGLARLALEILSLRSTQEECLRVVREYVDSELADDPSQDDSSCELYPLI